MLKVERLQSKISSQFARRKHFSPQFKLFHKYSKGKISCNIFTKLHIELLASLFVSMMINGTSIQHIGYSVPAAGLL